jgi:hypothetical protein
MLVIAYMNMKMQMPKVREDILILLDLDHLQSRLV